MSGAKPICLHVCKIRLFTVTFSCVWEYGDCPPWCDGVQRAWNGAWTMPALYPWVVWQAPVSPASLLTLGVPGSHPLAPLSCCNSHLPQVVFTVPIPLPNSLPPSDGGCSCCPGRPGGTRAGAARTLHTHPVPVDLPPQSSLSYVLCAGLCHQLPSLHCVHQGAGHQVGSYCTTE